MKKLSNLDNMFYFAYFLIIFSDLFNNIIIFEKILNFIDIFAILILLFIIFAKIKKGIVVKEYLPYILFCFIALISSYFCHNISVLKLPLLLMAFLKNNFDSKKFIKRDLISRSVLIVLLMFLYIIGIGDDYSGEIRNGILRHSFGAGHPNSFACYLLVIMLDISFLADTKKQKIFSIIISIMILLFIHNFVGSRTSEYLIIFSNFAMIFKNQIFKLSRLKLFPYSFCIISILTYLLCSSFNPTFPFYNIIDTFLSRRIYFSYEIIIRYPLSLFGNNIISDGYLILDNAYLNIIVRYGLLMFLNFSYLFYKGFNNIIKNKDRELFVNLLLMMLFGFTETPLIVPAKNPYLFSLSGFNYTKRSESDEFK